MTTQISLFDELPADTPETGVPATVYGQINQQQGHLLIESEAGDWLFLNTGGATIRCCLPGWDTAVDLSAADLRTVGDYCHRMADRIEARS